MDSTIIPDKGVFTTREVADILCVTPRIVGRWFDSGRLGGYRIPGSQDRRITREKLLSFIRSCSHLIEESRGELRKRDSLEQDQTDFRERITPQPDRLIAVSEKPLPESGRFLAQFPDGEMEVWSSEYPEREIVAWKPLPEPYVPPKPDKSDVGIHPSDAERARDYLLSEIAKGYQTVLVSHVLNLLIGGEE